LKINKDTKIPYSWFNFIEQQTMNKLKEFLLELVIILILEEEKAKYTGFKVKSLLDYFYLEQD